MSSGKKYVKSSFKIKKSIHSSRLPNGSTPKNNQAEVESHITEELSQYIAMKSSFHPDYGVYSDDQTIKEQSVIMENIQVEDSE